MDENYESKTTAFIPKRIQSLMENPNFRKLVTQSPRKCGLWIRDLSSGSRVCYIWEKRSRNSKIYELQDFRKVSAELGDIAIEDAMLWHPFWELLALHWIQVNLHGSPAFTEVCLWNPPGTDIKVCLAIRDRIAKIDERPLRRRRDL